MHKAIFLTVSFFILSACATNPIDYADSKPIAEDRVYAEYEKYSKADSARARVIFTRDSGMVGAAASLSLYVNGDLIARIRRKESISVYLPAGTNQLALGPGKATSGPVGQGLVEKELLAEGGSEYFYRVGLDMSVGLVLERSATGR